jgi:tetratricopeptide (TPR) repeat protein
MINKDYILRIAERIGRSLAIILRLRELDKHEEALIFIDECFLQSVGLTSSFINTLPEDMLLQMLSPLGALNVDKCLWVASLLKAEGEIYTDKGNANEAYYRYLKALNLFLAVHLAGQTNNVPQLYGESEELLKRLEDYDLPSHTKSQLVRYYELMGRYAKAEDTLFELLEAGDAHGEIAAQGQAFYARLREKSDSDLLAGNLSREEVEEGAGHFL